MTAGASVPEWVVRECVDRLRVRFEAVVEERALRAERIAFPLPRELR